MPREPTTAAPPLPETRSELREWILKNLRLQRPQETALLASIDAVLARHERLWQESKQDAIHALSAGFAARVGRLKDELLAKDATVSTISQYFEGLVADLTDRAARDPKTSLMHFARFVEQLESFLAVEQRVRWAAVGLGDLARFKWFNDTLGHTVGDRMIARVAELLRREVRSDDLVARDREGMRPADLHARLGGDEFCFLIPNLSAASQAESIAERFRHGVEHFDWSIEDPRLAQHPVRVDVGVVCLWLGPLGERRPIARGLAASLIQTADQLMYVAKSQQEPRINLMRAHVVNSELAEFAPGEEPVP